MRLFLRSAASILMELGRRRRRRAPPPPSRHRQTDGRTDGQTDGRTDHPTSYAATIQSYPTIQSGKTKARKKERTLKRGEGSFAFLSPSDFTYPAPVLTLSRSVSPCEESVFRLAGEDHLHSLRSFDSFALFAPLRRKTKHAKIILRRDKNERSQVKKQLNVSPLF